MRAYDPNDTFYAAAVLAVDGTVVSNDQAFEKQPLVPHIWTSEFVERALGLEGENASRASIPTKSEGPVATSNLGIEPGDALHYGIQHITKCTSPQALSHLLMNGIA